MQREMNEIKKRYYEKKKEDYALLQQGGSRAASPAAVLPQLPAPPAKSPAGANTISLSVTTF